MRNTYFSPGDATEISICLIALRYVGDLGVRKPTPLCQALYLQTDDHTDTQGVRLNNLVAKINSSSQILFQADLIGI